MASPKLFSRCGVTYIGQMEHEYMNINKLSCCSNCFALGFTKQLRRCNGCLLVDYCSRDCQKANWPKHKPFCNMVQGKGLKNAYLTSHTRDEVERILIDSYRLRVENDHVHREEDHGIHHPGKSIEGLVWSQGDAAEDFQRWLDLAESSGTLPEWWRFEDRMECLASAVDKNDEESIFKPIDQSELITRYEGDMAIRNALCIIAELIVGYDGKGPAKDGKWFEQFQEYLDLHADERARLIQGTVDAVKEALQTHGEEFKQPT